MIVRWFDPLNSRGFYMLEIDIFIEAAPASWACILDDQISFYSVRLHSDPNFVFNISFLN